MSAFLLAVLAFFSLSPSTINPVAVARDQAANPAMVYRYAASEAGVAADCSGLVKLAWDPFLEAPLPHNSRQMAAVTDPVEREDVRPGDLIFYGRPISHVAIAVDSVTQVEAANRRLGLVERPINWPKVVVVTRPNGVVYYDDEADGWVRVPVDAP